MVQYAKACRKLVEIWKLPPKEVPKVVKKRNTNALVHDYGEEIEVKENKIN